MRSACSATSALLHCSPMAQRVFLKHGGLSALSDCLSDYNVKIRSLALQSILIMIKGSRVSMNMSQNDRMKVVEEVRKDGGWVVVVAAVLPMLLPPPLVFLVRQKY